LISDVDFRADSGAGGVVVLGEADLEIPVRRAWVPSQKGGKLSLASEKI
jgi:hypothetical protein